MNTNEQEQQIETGHEYQLRMIKGLRQKAYACPHTGSDRMLSEVTRMQLADETGWEDKKAQAIARYEEIKAQYPWPENAPA